jgi:hypothetical protein
MPRVIMLSVVFAECRNYAHYGGCHYGECRYVEGRGIEIGAGAYLVKTFTHVEQSVVRC